MNYRSSITASLIVLITAFITNCNTDLGDELLAQERRLLEQYIEDNDITQDPTVSGLYYIPIVEGTGFRPSDKSWVEIDYVSELVDGTVFSTSYDSVAKLYGIYSDLILYGPARLQVGSIIDGLTEGLQLMNVGGTGKFIIPSKLAYGGASIPGIPPYSTLIYTVDLLSGYEDPDMHERMLIQKYLADNQFDVDSTDTGLYYIEQVEGSGDTIKAGDKVDLWYTGFFFDGRKFDSNIGGLKLTLILPSNNIIEGLNEGLMLMREGSQGILIVPYYLGYGVSGFFDTYTGQLSIPPYMTLLFDIRIDKVYPQGS